MKKILAFVGIMALSTAASYAFYSESNTSSVDMLRRQGYSESTLRVMDTVKFNARGMNGKYERRFIPVAQNSKLGRSYTYLKNYIDPMQDDGDFARHQINFTNTVNSDETHYSQKSFDVRGIDNL